MTILLPSCLWSKTAWFLNKLKEQNFIKKVEFDINLLNKIICDENASNLTKETAKIKLIKLKEFLK